MIAQKHITIIVAVLMAVAVCLCLIAMFFAGPFVNAAGGVEVAMEYESVLFDTSKVIDINIVMDEDDWEDMLANATEERYYQCNVEINGEVFYRVGIRPKGNTSLTSIASDPTTDRYSFKLEFDQYVDGQTCYGLDKLVLNNNYADATNMKEALIYDMYQYLGADASLYNYAKISVNGSYWGVYLALEAVEDSFLLRNYGVSSGELYKPDSLNFDNMGGGNFDIENMTPPAADGDEGTPSDLSQLDGKLPDGFGLSQPDGASSEEGNADGFDRFAIAEGDIPAADAFPARGGMFGSGSGSGGADLNYSGDELDSYSTIWESEVTSTNDSDHKRVVAALKNISEGTDLEQYMDIDNLLKYMAVHVFSVNEDSLSGAMAHNYYLYEENGQLNLLPWDYNLALGGMGGGDDATSMVNDAIDDAFSGTDFFDTLMENEEYHAQYYAYLQQLVDEYLLGEGFEQFYNRTRDQLDALVESDPTAFYTYEEYMTAVETLYEVVKLRGQSIEGQLNGTIPSTEAEQRQSDACIDASHIDLSVMGSMDMGGGRNSDAFPFNWGEGGHRETTNEGFIEAEGTAQTESGENDISASSPPFTTSDESNAQETTPEGLDPSQLDGQNSENLDPSQLGGTPPEDFDPSQFSTNMPEGFDMPRADGNSTQDTGFEDSSSAKMKNLITYGICFTLLAAAFIFVKRYRRKSRKC